MLKKVFLYLARYNFEKIQISISKIPSPPLLRVFISGEQTKETDENVGSLFLSGLQSFVIGRRNDETIRLLSKTFGLLHSVRNDEI
jgi:hypothetical protein